MAHKKKPSRLDFVLNDKTGKDTGIQVSMSTQDYQKLKELCDKEPAIRTLLQLFSAKVVSLKSIDE